MFEKRFCPLLTKDLGNPVYCNKNCMWYIENEDAPNFSCVVPVLLASQNAVVAAIEQAKKNGSL